MIKSFRDKGLKLFWETGNTRKLSVQNPKRIRHILNALDAATLLADANLPGFRWHPLGEMDPGRYAIEASGNWRVTYAWDDGSEDGQPGPVAVDLQDYH